MQIDRRNLISKFALATCAMAVPGLSAARAGSSFFEEKKLPIGLQLYTLGPEAGKDLDATLAQVAAIGFREIELPGLFGRKPAEIAASARRAGLTIGSVHLPLLAGSGMPGLSLGSEPGKIAEDLGALGTKWAVAPLLMLPAGFRPQPGESMEAAISRSVIEAGADVWKKTAAALNEKAAALKDAGIRVAYHNHNLEFAPIEQTTGWDILWRETQSDLVSFEVDIGWVSTAGIDPVTFLNKVAGRARLLHVKDVAPDNPHSYRISMKPAEVGYGKLDFRTILPAAYAAGVRHFIVEQEPPFTIPRIEAARKSFDYLAGLKA